MTLLIIAILLNFHLHFSSHQHARNFIPPIEYAQGCDGVCDTTRQGRYKSIGMYGHRTMHGL